MHEVGFYSPPDWQLTVLKDPRGWHNVVMLSLYGVRAPELARRN